MLARLSRISPKSLLGTLLRLPLRAIPKSAVVRVRSGINEGSSWIVGSTIHGCWLGTYEAEKQALVAKLVRPGMIVWDIGANAGFYTLAFSRLVGPTGRVYAFEPFAENVANILKHVRMNNLQNTIVVQAAMGREAGVTGFRTADSNSMGSLSYDERTYLVPVLTADGFLGRSPESRPDLVKIDVEGAESDVFAGAGRMLESTGTAILLALHGEQQERLCCEALSSLGFSIFYLDGTVASDRPLRSDEVYATRAGALQ